MWCVLSLPHCTCQQTCKALPYSCLQIFDEMQRRGVQPTVVTYGCMLNACQRSGDVARAFALYKQACQLDLTSDQLHNILIRVCTENGR